MAKPTPKLYRVLVLEDDLEVASAILAALHRTEPHLAPFDFDVTLLSTCESVEELVNRRKDRHFDAILLDRDCKLHGSFHSLDVEFFGPERVISISSTPAWNLEAHNRGITRIVPKSFNDIDGFAPAPPKQFGRYVRPSSVASLREFKVQMSDKGQLAKSASLVPTAAFR